jgi:hypothetical protein
MTAKLEDELSRITYDDLHAALTGSPETLGVHLELIERDIQIDGHSVRIHCHCLTVDANGRVQPKRLAAFILEGRQDLSLKLEHLMTQMLPPAWAEQASMFLAPTDG